MTLLHKGEGFVPNSGMETGFPRVASPRSLATPFDEKGVIGPNYKHTQKDVWQMAQHWNFPLLSVT